MDQLLSYQEVPFSQNSWVAWEFLTFCTFYKFLGLRRQLMVEAPGLRHSHRIQGISPASIPAGQGFYSLVSRPIVPGHPR